MRITDTFIDFTVENCEKINKHWLFRKKFMTFYCHGGDESVDIGTFATGQELYDAINQYCNQYNCTPANVELECNGYNDEILKIYNFEGALDGTKKAVSETNDFCLELVISKNSLSRSSDLPTATQLSGVLSKATKAVPYTLTAPMLGGLIANKNEIKQSIKDFEKKIALWDKKPISNEYAFLLFVLSKLPHESSRNQSFYVIEENGNYRVRFSGHNALARYLSKNEQYKIGITFQSKDTPITFEPTFDVFYKEHVYYTEYLASDVLRDILQGIVDVLKGGFYNVPCDKELYSPNEKRYKEHFNINGLNGNNEPKIVSDLREKYNDRLFAFDNDNDYTFYGQDAEIISELFDIKISNGKCSVNKDFINRNLHKILKNNRIAFVDKITSFKQNGNFQSFHFAQELSTRYLAGEKYDWTHAQKLAKELKIEATNQELMQACELAVVLTARKLASENLSIAERFQSMRDLYDQQVTVQPLDTKGRRLQQYSTPCPLAFLLGEYVKNAKSDSNRYLEPSAGNGMLTIALPPENTIVNELDEIRVANLKTLGFERVTQGDARELPATPIYKGIITNPPFAIVDKPETRNSWTLNALDYILTAHALDSMADNGRAAIIVGGKMWGDYWKPLSERSEKKVLYGKWKWFVGYLYAQYNVIDVIYVDSHGIYNKQGTTYPIVIILIDGRHQYNEDNKPNYVFDTDRDVIINNYQQLFERIVPHIQPQPAQVDDKSKRARALMLKIKMAKAKI